MDQGKAAWSEVLREVLRAASQYKANSSQSHLCYLSKHLEALQNSCLRPGAVHQLENDDHIEWIECISFLVDVVREKQSPLELVLPVLKTLRCLAEAETMQKLLYETFNVCTLLAGQVVMLSSIPEEETALLEALQLLHKLTYGRRVDYNQENMDSLIKFLIDVVLDEREVFISPGLGCLANLCRQNVLVQSAIRNRNGGNYKKLLKKLCAYFGSDNKMLIIFSLSIFYSLSINDNADEHKVFFNKGEVEHILQIVFWIIVNGSKTVAWKYAADLLADMLWHPQMQICIKRYQHLPKCMAEVLTMLAIVTEETATELFKVLLRLCSSPVVRGTVNSALFTPLIQGKVSPDVLLDAVKRPSITADTEPLLCCLHWSIQTSRGSVKGPVSCAALDFLLDSCQDCLCEQDSGNSVKHLVAPVATMLSQPEQTESTDKTLRLIKLLAVLCERKECCEAAGKVLQLSTISTLIEKQLSHSYVSYAAVSSSVLNEAETKKTSDKCMLAMLDLAVRLRKYVPGLQDYLAKLLQDPRLHDVLALGLTSANQENVGIALRLLYVSNGLEDAHPDVVLCSSVATLNSGKQKSLTYTRPGTDAHLSTSYLSLDANKENHRPSPLCCSTPVPNTVKLSEYDRLLNSTQQSVENITQIKDSKNAEMIEVFEHHIKTLEIKGEHLNDLLEAKTMALAQADRVIGQLRSREAAHTLEMKKLQNILKTSDSKIEKTITEMNTLRIQSEQKQAQMNTQLEGKMQEISTLNKKCSEARDICSNLQDKISAVEQEKKSLSNMVENLQNAHEKLKEQYTILCGQSKELEEERKTLSKQLKDRDASLHKSTSTLQDLQKKHKTTEKERAELEKEKEDMEAYIDKLRDQLSASENSARSLQQRTSMLEGITNEQGSRLDQQTERIAELEAELEKHNQIVSFISSMNLNAGQPPKK